MTKRFTKLLCCAATIIFLSTEGNAQVTVGTDKKPANGALLDLKTQENANLNPSNYSSDDLITANQGLLFPRVKLNAYNDITLSGVSSDSDKLKATGMVVYNTNSAAEGLMEGLVQWNGEEWQPLGGLAPKASISGIDCDNVIINGAYVKQHPLIADKNTMVLPVHVSRKGSYNIRVVALKGNGSNESNGYVFAARGEFASAGYILVTLTGQGTPTLAYNDYGAGVKEDILEIHINGELVRCNPNVHARLTITNKVYDVFPEYTYSCSSIKAETNFVVKRSVDPSTDKITLRVFSYVSGAEYHIYSSEINGVKFEARGILLKGTQQIILRATGTPQAGGTYDYFIYSNSVKQSSQCHVSIRTGYPAFKIQIYGSNSGNWGLYGNTDNTMYQITNNPELFGLGRKHDAPIDVSSITVQGSTSNAVSYIPPDVQMVFVSYDNVPGTTMINALANFVKNGGFLIYSVENENALKNIAERVYDVTGAARGFTTNYDGEGANRMPLSVGNHLVNGLYANLEGKYAGRDGGGNYCFDINDNRKWTTIISNGNGSARAVLSKQYPLILIGDGGFFSGGIPSFQSNDAYHPARVDNNGVPIPATRGIYNGGGGGCYNSAFLVNLIMWAIEEWNNK